MKVLLVQPSHLKAEGTVFRSRKLPYPGLALPLLAGMVPAGTEVEIVNDYNQRIEYRNGHDLVALSAMTPQIDRAYQIADRFRSLGKQVVIGGFHASFAPEEVLKHADAAAVGEAEDIWPRILEDARSGKLGGIYRAERHPDLSNLPAPRFDLLHRNGYALRATPIQTTRGCPKRCEFCSVHQFFGGSYRHQPIAHVIRDIKAAGTPFLFFVDDNIAADRPYTMELLEAVRPLRKVWGAQCNISAGEDDDFLKAARRAGCHSLFLGIETINPEALKRAKKGINIVKEYRRLLKNMMAHDILPQASMIMGLDGDGEESFDATYEFLMELKIPIAYFFILTPAPNTMLFERFTREGRLFDQDWSKYGGDTTIFHPTDMTPEVLDRRFWELLRKFYAPKSIIRRLFWPPKFSYTTLMALKYNVLHYRSLKRGNHPLRG